EVVVILLRQQLEIGLRVVLGEPLAVTATVAGLSRSKLVGHVAPVRSGGSGGAGGSFGDRYGRGSTLREGSRCRGGCGISPHSPIHILPRTRSESQSRCIRRVDALSLPEASREVR